MKNYKILTTVGYYLPGYKAGGPIQTVANIVGRLGDYFQFKILTLDRDLDDTTPYSKIKIDDWNRVGKAEVFYMSSKMRSLGGFKKIISSTEYDVIYINSFFSPHFTIIPLLLRRLRVIPYRPLIIAPRGEFSVGALGLKKIKKRVYILAAKTLGLYRGVVWQASSEHEKTDIQRWFGKDVPVISAPNLAPLFPDTDKMPSKCKKKPGCLKILSLSRISRMKNVDGALKMIAGIKGKIQFDIYGPIEDKAYWAECKVNINRLSENIKIRYCGMVTHQQVAGIMRAYDLFFLPTLGENFGHVILEALCAGCPVLISDQTPWRDLEEKGVGWDLPLTKPEMFQDVLQQCIDMDNELYMEWSEKAWKYGVQVSQDKKTVDQNRALFLRAMKTGKKNV